MTLRPHSPITYAIEWDPSLQHHATTTLRPSLHNKQLLPTLNLYAMAPVSVPQDADAYEERYVHQVYAQIASHFSSTRYKVTYFNIRLS